MEEVKKTKTTTKKVDKEAKEKKVVKTTKKETVKKDAPKKEVKKTVTKEVKKPTVKKAATKASSTKKEVVKETPKKEKKVTTTKETKVEKKPVAKKTTTKVTVKEEVVKEAPKKEKKVATKKEAKVEKEPVVKKATVKKATTKKTPVKKVEKKSFVPDEDDRANYMANKAEIDEENYAKLVYDSTFDHFYGEPYIGADLEFDASWETSSSALIRERFNLAKEDANRIKTNKEENNVKKEERLPRQVEIDEKSLANEIAEKLHNDWCDNEIKEFYERARFAKGNYSQSIENILNAACYKKGKKTNEISINRDAFKDCENDFVEALDNFELFKSLVGKDNTYVVEVRKYVKRNLENHEKQSDFKASTGEENILRPFEELSYASKKENVEAATRAVYAYKDLAAAGISLDEMRNADNMNLAVKAMHISNLKKNSDNKTYFNTIDEDTKNKEKMVFGVLVDVVENAREYTLYPVEGASIPDYDQLENDIITGVVKVEPTPISNARPMTAYEAEEIVKKLEEGIDVFGEGEVEKPKINTMGYVGVWMTAIATAGLTATIFALAAFYLK